MLVQDLRAVKHSFNFTYRGGKMVKSVPSACILSIPFPIYYFTQRERNCLLYSGGIQTLGGKCS